MPPLKSHFDIAYLVGTTLHQHLNPSFGNRPGQREIMDVRSRYQAGESTPSWRSASFLSGQPSDVIRRGGSTSNHTTSALRAPHLSHRRLTTIRLRLLNMAIRSGQVHRTKVSQIGSYRRRVLVISGCVFGAIPTRAGASKSLPIRKYNQYHCAIASLPLPSHLPTEWAGFRSRKRRESCLKLSCPLRVAMH
jgi:hypothetical protein